MRFHIFIAIDSNNYDGGLLSRLGALFSPQVCKIHACIMGPTTKGVLTVIDKYSLETYTEIVSPTFNYSYITNTAIKEQYNKKIIGDKDIIVLLDSWTALSMMQIEVYLRNVDLSNKYLCFDIIRDDYKGEPLNKNSAKLMLSIMKRLKMQYKNSNYTNQKLIPVPILLVENFMHANGLDENMFTDVSRLKLIQFLERNGLQRFECKPEVVGIRLNSSPVYSEELTKLDMDYYNSISPLTGGNKIAIPSNIDVEWGKRERLKYLKIENKIPKWLDIEKTSNMIVRDENDNKQDSEVVVSDKSSISFSEQTFVIENERGYNDTLVAIRNNVPDIMCASHYIKQLYLENGPVTIFTDRKIFPPIDSLSSFMIKDVFDLPQYQAKPVDFSKFKKILRIEGFTRRVDIPEAEDKPLSFDGNPYCSALFPSRKMPNNCVCFVMSVKPESYRLIHDDLWESCRKIFSKLVKFKLPMFMLALEKERVFIQNISAKNIEKEKIAVAIDRPLDEAISIVNCSKTVISVSESDLAYIAYGLKKHTIIVHDKMMHKMESSNIRYINYGEDDCESKVAKMVIENM